jgi:hypothetical protein
VGRRAAEVERDREAVERDDADRDAVERGRAGALVAIR